VTAKDFVIDAYKRLHVLAEGNAAIGLTEQQTPEGIRLGCHYGVGIGYYDAAEALRSMAIRWGVINPSEVPVASNKVFQHSAEAQAQGLGASNRAIVCPLNRNQSTDGNTPQENRNTQNDRYPSNSIR
jgi:hypothetical protein